MALFHMRRLVFLACLVPITLAIGWSGSAATALEQKIMPSIPNSESDVPVVKHEKKAGSGFLPGSPYYAKQQVLAAAGIEDDVVEKGKDEDKVGTAKVLTKYRTTKEFKEKGTDKKVEKKADDGDKEGDHPGGLMAVSMFLTIGLFSMVIALLSTSNTVINSHSWFVLDQVILIFMAVMNFQAFGALLDCCITSPHGKLLTAALQAFGLFLIAFFISWKIKADPIALAIWCGGGAHFVSFASIHLTEVVEDEYSGENALWRKLLVFGCFALVFFVFSAAVCFLKKRARLNDDDWDDKITDTENDFIAMAMAVVWTTFVFHLVIGKDHDLEVGPGDAEKIPQGKELLLLAYAIVLIPASVMVNRYISKMNSSSYIVKRMAMFLGGFASMASCWTFLFLGQMHFYSHFCSTRPLFCRIVLAMMTNVIAAIGIIILSKVSESRGDASISREVSCALTALSLGAAWSWEQTFDAAMDASVDHFGAQVHHLKLIMSATLILIILPSYVNYIKPIVNQKTACLGG